MGQWRGDGVILNRRWVASDDLTKDVYRGGFWPEDLRSKDLVVKRGVPLADLWAVPLLLLLGEAGLGKSYAIEAYRQEVPEGQIAFVDLRRVTQHRSLENLIEEELSRLASGGANQAEVWIDSYEECFARFPETPRVLGEWIASNHERLRIRIATRPFPGFRQLLSILEGGQLDFRSYELQHLSESDARRLLEAWGHDAEVFLAEVHRLGIADLASMPVYLKLLASQIKSKGWPTSRLSAYQAGLLGLAEEPDEIREGTASAQKLSSAQRLRIATQIAAILTFGVIAGIWAGSESTAPEGSMTIAQVEEACAESTDATFKFSKDDVAEALRTGLFRADRGLASFSHLSFQEFLTAQWIVDRGLTERQARSLLCSPVAPRRFLPQYSGATGWLMAMKPGLLTELLEDNILVLLGGDESAWSDETKDRALSSVLRAAAIGATLPYWSIAGYCRWLRTSRSEQIVKKWLTRSSAPSEVRKLCVDLVDVLDLTSLRSYVLKLILNPRTPVNVRHIAIIVWARRARPEEFLALRPLWDRTNDRETHTILFSYLWPDLLTIRDLTLVFGLDRWPWRDHGFPKMLFERASDEHLPDLLTIATWQVRSLRLGHYWSGGFISLIQRALHQLGDRRVARRLARLIRINRHHHSQIRELGDVLDGARAEGIDLMPLAASMSEYALGEATPHWATSSSLELLSSEVAEWLLAKILVSEKAQQVKLAHRLTHHAFRYDHPIWPRVLNSGLKPRELASLFPDLMAPLLVDGEEHRHYWAMHRLETRRRGTSKPPRRWLREYGKSRDELLAAAEAGDWNALGRLYRHFDSSPILPRQACCDPIVDKPGWADLSGSNRHRVESASMAIAKLLLRQVSEDELNIKSEARAWCLLQALELCAVQQAPFLDTLAAKDWSKVAKLVVGSLRVRTLINDEVAGLSVLLAEAYRRVPDVVVESLHSLRGAPNLNLTCRLFAPFWDVRLQDEWFAVALHSETPADEARGIKLRLIEAENVKTLDLVDEILESQPWSRDDLGLLGAAVRYWPNRFWPKVERLLQSGRPGLKALMAMVADERGPDPRWLNSLSADSLVALWELMKRRRWRKENSRSHDGLSRLSNDILALLSTRGNPEDVHALQRFLDKEPREKWRGSLLHRGTLAYLQRAVQPVVPSVLVRLPGTPKNRLLYSDADLQDLVVEILEQYEESLAQGAWRDFWNDIEGPAGKPSPKRETDLQRHLKLIIEAANARRTAVNREVLVKPGSHLDIIVQSWSPNQDYLPLEVRAEVKLSDNSSVLDDLAHQLVDRYLDPKNRWHGVYVVGFVHCAAYGGGTKKEHLQSPQALREALEAKARVVSERGFTVKVVVLDLRHRSFKAREGEQANNRRPDEEG